VSTHSQHGLQLRGLQATTAEAELVHATDAAPSDADLLVREGVALEGRGEALDALDCYEAALELDPASWEACFRLGSLNVAHGLVEEAAELFERALELNPAHDASAQCLALLEDVDVGALGDEIDAALEVEQAALDAGEAPDLVPVEEAQRSSVVRVRGFLDDAGIDELLAAAAAVEAEVGAVERASRGGGWSTVYMNDKFRRRLPLLHERIFREARAADEAHWGGVLRDRRALNLRCAEAHAVTPPGSLAYERHYDQGSLVTVDVMLSDAAAFEGGQFSTLEEDDVLKNHAFEKGDLLLFLSHKYHCVAPVDAGERRVFVAEIWEGEARDCAGRCVQPAGAVCVSCGAFTGSRA
jgi:tetratricopeptide (TPR) repeat protein